MDARHEKLDAARLYLLATSALCRRSLAETVREALAGGVQIVQLREKDLPDAAFATLAEEIGRIVADAGALFFLNDRVEIAATVGCDGVHVGQDDRSVTEARALVEPGKLIGLSTHGVGQAQEATRLGADYIGIGPTFETATKDTGYTPRGVELAAEVAAVVPVPAFAIGGIDADTLPGLTAAGVRRIAVSSAICSEADPRGAAALLRELLEA